MTSFNQQKSDPRAGVMSLLVIQPTPFCNVDCDYCYLPNRDDRSKMSLSTLRAVLSKVFSSPYIGSDLTIVWHAGEPLVLPVEFYKAATAITNELCPPHCHVRHSIQTNGTLISPEWCDFFLECDVRVGVSIDGPRDIHDLHRKTRGRKGTFDRVVTGIELLKRAGKDFHVISVLTETNIFMPDVMFYFYDWLNISEICFNVEESDGVHGSSLLKLADVRWAYLEFLEAFMFLVHRYGRKWSVREFEVMRRAVFRPEEAEFRNPQVEPFGIVCVDINGNFTTFSPEFVGMKDARFGDFVIGNLASGSLADAISNPRFLELYREIMAGVEACRNTCEYFSICGGGAPANKLGEHGRMDVASTKFCDCTVKSSADLILSLLDSQLAPREDGSGCS